MEKRYQVFISSTYTDLKEERMAVHKAVLELNQMPAGMELFPSADAEAWNIIKDQIDESDYYLLVVGGRYGSTDDSGLGFTEKEYDFAVSAKKPVIAILHKAPEQLPRERTETEAASWDKLQVFRKKVEKKHTCTYWTNPDDLKAKAIVGLTSAIKRTPGTGWVRADSVPSDATVTEILNLRKKIAEMEQQFKDEIFAPPKGSEDLEQGNDELEIDYWYTRRVKSGSYSYDDYAETGKVKIPWNTIFSLVAPEMVDEAPKTLIKSKIELAFGRYARFYARKEKKNKDQKLVSFTYSEDEVNTVIVQFRALGYIQESRKSRSVRDTQTYWRLTPYGDSVMTQLVARRKNKNSDPEIDDPVEDA